MPNFGEPEIPETTMNSICIFLGSNPGADPVYARAAQKMGRELAAHGLTCVYGGSNTGLMKLLADSALEAVGRVIGVTVQALRDKARQEGFLKAPHRKVILRADTPAQIIKLMKG